MMKVLVTGSCGRLGKELVRLFPDALHPSHGGLNIENRSEVARYLLRRNPNVIIHCAAMTDVVKCELDRKEAYATNVAGTKNLIDYSGGCYFVFVSSACVFHGDVGHYSELDLPYPKNYYGLTKLLAETIVQESPSSLTVRTNFVAKQKWAFPRAFIDRYGTYLFASDVAKAIKQLVEKRMFGIVHVCGEEKLSMFDLAKITTPDVKPMTLKDYVGKASLTVDMSLTSVKINPFKISRCINETLQ